MLPAPAAPTSYYGGNGVEREKAQAPYAPYYAATPAPAPAPPNPYATSAPPMAMAYQPQEAPAPAPAAEAGKQSKVGEMGKKFGKKLGNATIFGAGSFPPLPRPLRL